MQFTQEDLSKHSGVTYFRIRHYVRTGLLAPAHGEGSARFYGDDHAERLAVIERLRKRGMRWKEIRAHLASKSAKDLRILTGLEVAAPVVDLTKVHALRDAVDALVCVAAESLDMSPRALRPALASVFVRMREVGLTAAEVASVLEPAKG